MISITSNYFSFVKFASSYTPVNDWNEKQLPGTDIAWCLPVAKEDDLYFQFYLEASDSTETALLCSLDKDNMFFLLSKGINTPVDLTAYKWPNAANVSNGQFIEKIRLTDTKFLLSWRYPFNHLIIPNPDGSEHNLDIGDCFQLRFGYDVGAGPVMLGISNCMEIVDEDYTNVLEYQHPTDDYGFNYCANTNFKNRLRLPIFWSNPAYKQEQAVYVKSNGQRKVTKDITYKQYDFETDYMPQWAIDAFVAALMHETKKIYGQGQAFEIVKDGDLELQSHKELGYPLSKISFKAWHNGWMLKRDNCEDCNTYEDPSSSSIYNIGEYYACDTFVVNISTLLASCSTPRTVSFVFWQSGLLNAQPTINLVAKTVTFKIKNSPFLAHTNLPLFSIKVETPTSVNTMTVSGTWNGSSHC